MERDINSLNLQSCLLCNKDMVITCLTLYRKINSYALYIYRVLEMSAVKLLFEDVPSQHNISSVHPPVCPLLRFPNVDNF